MHLAQDSDKWRAFFKMVMYIQVPQKVGNFLTSERILVSQRLCSMELVACIIVDTMDQLPSNEPADMLQRTLPRHELIQQHQLPVKLAH